MIFKKDNLNNLFNEYQKSLSIAKELRNILENIPYENIEPRVSLTKKTLDRYYKAFDLSLKIIRRFSPTAAKLLREQLSNFKKLADEDLNRDYRILLKTKHIEPSEDIIVNLTNSTITRLMNFLNLHAKFFNLAIITTIETFKYTRGKPPMELNEYIRDILEKIDSSCAKLYEGAWNAFHSENPDRYRHMATSLRELLKKLLGDKPSKMKEKIKNISGSNTTSMFIISLADSIEKLYETLCKGVHGEIDKETALLSLRIMESIIEYLDGKGLLE